MADMDIKQVSVGLLKASTYNPRKWDQPAIDGLTESIKRFGLVDPSAGEQRERSQEHCDRWSLSPEGSKRSWPSRKYR
jgi:ParB-like chromosome segregation protein Spo0J